MSNEIKKSKAIKIISLSNICVLLIVAVADIINNTMWQQLYNTSSFTELFLWRFEGLFSLLIIPALFIAELVVVIKNRKSLKVLLSGIALMLLDFLLGFYTIALVCSRF